MNEDDKVVHYVRNAAHFQAWCEPKLHDGRNFFTSYDMWIDLAVPIIDLVTCHRCLEKVIEQAEMARARYVELELEAGKRVG